MGAPKGNQYYRLRSKSGRDKEYNKDLLLKKANEYFEWCLSNPLKESQIVKYRDSYEIVELSKMRVFSVGGLCNFLEIAYQTFLNYGKDDDLIEVVTRIKGIIEMQQLEGAAANMLNPNIIARKLGLSEKTESKDVVYNTTLSKKEAKKIAKSIFDEI